MADLKIVISALNKASGDLNKVKQDISGVKDAGKEANPAVKGFGDSLGGMMSKAALVAGAVAGVGLAMKEVYESAKEAAELDYARDKFDALSESIGTTADTLLTDLREATDGIVSDADLIEGAGQIMALGLADSHEEVLRLATVAGELDMNMNQLVLTLTNETTMRFDALGLSVDGFDEKVKHLEETGMSASEAFREAFLQQAEDQIERVGKKSETSAGKIQIMESAFKNLGYAVKLTLAGAMDSIAPLMTDLADGMTENVEIGIQWEEAINKLKLAKDKDLITGKEYNQLMRDIGVHSGMGAISAEQLAMAQAKVNQVYGYAEDGVVTYTEAITMGKAQIALMAAETDAVAVETLIATGNYEGLAAAIGVTEDEAKGMIKAWQDAEAAHEKMVAEMESITTLNSNYKGIIGLGYKFTDILEDITEQEKIMAEEPIGSEKYDEAKGKVEELKGAMADLANQVTLDMFQATIAIGGVTEAEFSAYMNLAIDMGTMSEEGAQAAIDAYGNAISYISGLEIDEKTVNVVLEVDDSAVKSWGAPTKTGTVHYQTSEWFTKAVGGAVYGGNPYTWQEYGYKGELFVPSSNGFVLSRADAERALSRALAGEQSALDPDAIGKAVARALSGITSGKSGGGNVYNLTMPTSSNPADVRTAFELMEAWNA